MKLTKAAATALLLLPAAAGCVMPGDLDRLQQNLDAFESGAVSKPEFDAANQRVFDEIDERTAAAVEAARGAARLGTGELVTGLGTLLVAGGGLYMKTKRDAVIQVNAERDKKYVPKEVARS